MASLKSTKYDKKKKKRAERIDLNANSFTLFILIISKLIIFINKRKYDAKEYR